MHSLKECGKRSGLCSKRIGMPRKDFKEGSSVVSFMYFRVPPGSVRETGWQEVERTDVKWEMGK